MGTGTMTEAMPGWDLDALAKGYHSRFASSGESARAARGGVRFFASHGRSELGGNHTDHNHGKVIAAALDLPALAAVQAREDAMVHVVSDGWDNDFLVDLSHLDPVPSETGTTQALIRGVAFFLRGAGCKVGGFNAWISSKVLPGSGLSSSAAMEVLFGCIQSGLYNEGAVDPVLLAQIGQKAENRHFGKPCGLMDQMACAHGGVLAIDFKDPSAPVSRGVELDLAAYGLALVITDTGGNHADLTPDYAAMPKEMKEVARELGCEVLRDVDESAFLARLPELARKLSHRALLRAMHFFEENRRVDRMLAALLGGDIAAYLHQVRLSGLSSALYLQNVFTPQAVDEQGITLALALSEAILGDRGAWRVHGGGLAGTVQAYVPVDMVDAYVARMDSVFGSGCARVLSILNHKAGEILPAGGKR